MFSLHHTALHKSPKATVEGARKGERKQKWAKENTDKAQNEPKQKQKHMSKVQLVSICLLYTSDAADE